MLHVDGKGILSLARWSYIRHGEETDRHRQCISGFECSRRRFRSHHRDHLTLLLPGKVLIFAQGTPFYDITNGALNRTRLHDQFSTPPSHSSHPYQLPPSAHKGLPTSAPLAKSVIPTPSVHTKKTTVVLFNAVVPGSMYNSLCFLLMSSEEAHNGSS